MWSETLEASGLMIRRDEELTVRKEVETVSVELSLHLLASGRGSMKCDSSLVAWHIERQHSWGLTIWFCYDELELVW